MGSACCGAGRAGGPHVLVKTHGWSDGWARGRAAHVLLTHRDLRGVVASYRRMGWAPNVKPGYVADHLRWHVRSAQLLATGAGRWHGAGKSATGCQRNMTLGRCDVKLPAKACAHRIYGSGRLDTSPYAAADRTSLSSRRSLNGMWPLRTSWSILSASWQPWRTPWAWQTRCAAVRPPFHALQHTMHTYVTPVDDQRQASRHWRMSILGTDPGAAILACTSCFVAG